MAQAAAVLPGRGRPPGQDALLPRAPGGNGAGAALALLVHAGLIAALTVSVDWRANTPDAVSAELWAAVPQMAAPPAPAPEPPPVAPAPPAPSPAPAPAPAPAPPPRVEAQPSEADIATERAARRKAEADRKRAEADAEREKERAREQDRERERAADARKAEAARKKADADKKEADRKKQEQADQAQRQQAQRQQAQRDAKAEEQRLAKQREDNLKRLMAQAGPAGEGSPTSSGTAARDAAPSAGYAGRLVALIRRNSVFTGSVDGNPATEVEVRAGPGGTIIARRIVKTSGSKAWDDAVLQAIDKTGTLPRDTDGRVPPLLIITFRPHE